MCPFKGISNHFVLFLKLSVKTVFCMFNDIFEGSRRECGDMEIMKMMESWKYFMGLLVWVHVYKICKIYLGVRF